MARKRYLIVGDGAAGLTAAEEIRRRDAEAAVGIFCDEPNPGYFRAALTNFLLGELREDQLWAVAPNFYDARRIDRLFTRVLRVDPARRELWCSGNPTPLRYDALLVAAGARARPPAFPGGHLPGVLTLRTIQDARRVVDTLRGNVRRAVVLGGGALGLEWTHALLERGLHVTLLERAPRFMPRALDAVASDLLAARLRKAGVDIVLGEEVALAEQAPSGAVGSLVTQTGRRIACDLVACALGIVPNSELLEHSGISCTANGAVVVDASLASSAPGIWAAGDVASVEGVQLGLWEPARHQGRVAAVNMCGGQEQYRPGVHYFATRLFDLDFARLGELDDAPGRTTLLDFPRGTGHIAYRKLVLEGGRLRGALLLGEKQAKVRAIGRGLKRLIDAGADVSSVAERLLDPSFDVAGFLETRKLLAKPELQPGSTRAVPAAKLRGAGGSGSTRGHGATRQRRHASARCRQPQHRRAAQQHRACDRSSCDLRVTQSHVGVAQQHRSAAQPHLALASVATAPHQDAVDRAARRGRAGAAAQRTTDRGALRSAGPHATAQRQVVQHRQRAGFDHSLERSGGRLFARSSHAARKRLVFARRRHSNRNLGQRRAASGCARAARRRPRAVWTHGAGVPLE